MTGVSLRPAHDQERPGASGSRPSVVLHALSFVGGFTLIFIALGASASLLGRFLITNQLLLGKIAGVLVAAFGLHTMGLLHIPWLDRQKSFQYRGATEIGRAHV